MKLAHLILAHKDAELLERLVNRLRHKQADIFIQLDKKTDITPFKFIADIPNTYFIVNRGDIGYCNYSTVAVTIKAMEEILSLKNEYSHINLISGQDYPLKPVETIQQYFFANAGKSFMHTAAIGEGEWPDGENRFKKYNFGDWKIPGKYICQTIANALLPNRKLPEGLKPYGRSQWMTITPVAAQYVIDYIQNNPKAEKYFKYVFAVDEVFFQTILVNSPLKDRLESYNLRYIILDSGKRPVNYTMAHAEALTQTDAFFARKFERPVSLEVLDYLDTIVDARGKN
jgi:hypothetical protein